ncbi:MAG: glycoside hydrolase family 78 protein [Bacteroidales bacterium]|nr:glycoside hydrolase family 78 protein [Bacteroidales bacterium]
MDRRSVTVLLLAGVLYLVSCCPSGRGVGQLTDALESSAWDSSVWISAADAPVVTGRVMEKTDCRAADGASWFIRSVPNASRLESAVWMTSGLGVYQLFVNGKPVGEEILKPGFTHYAKTKIAFTYDVTDAMRKVAGAENLLSVQVTPGWWADKIVTPKRHRGMIGRKPAFRGVLKLSYSDGSTELIGTDTLSWRAGVAGPVTHAAIFDGEEYDARIPVPADGSNLGVPELNEEFNGEIVPTAGAEIYFREDLAMKPVEAYVWRDVEGDSEEAYGTVVKLRDYSRGGTIRLHPGEVLVVDFGQNAAAVPDFVFSAAEGTVLSCLPAELLNDGNGALSRGMDGPEGSCHRTNLRIPADGMILQYTFSGRGREHYRPHCTFFGYRYISVEATGDVRISGLKSVPVSSISEALETGSIITGSDDVNRLISNTLWGQRSNYLSVPTDCPQRNERLGWTADTQVFTETGTFFADTRSFFHKWMRDMRDSQTPEGSFPGVAPTAQYGGSLTRLGWADAGVIVPWTVWKQFGDTAIVEENWESMKLWMDHIAPMKYDHQALAYENGNSQYADWLSYEPLETASHRAQYKDAAGKWQPLPESIEYWSFLSACYLVTDAWMMADMAAATGRDASEYLALADETREYMRGRFFTPDGLFRTDILNTMQTPALFALRCKLFEGDARGGIIERLRANFEEHENCLQTGFLGTSILMQTLSDNDMADIAWELLLQHRNPSWLYSVDNGATTIWERWNSYTIESGMGPKGMNSFNHYAYGCVCQWLWETVAGIAADPAQPGFRHIIMKPVPDRRLGSIDASFHSAAGLITSSWEYDGDEWLWDFSIPEGATASVTLPGETEAKEYTSGDYHLTVLL